MESDGRVDDGIEKDREERAHLYTFEMDAWSLRGWLLQKFFLRSLTSGWGWVESGVSECLSCAPGVATGSSSEIGSKTIVGSLKKASGLRQRAGSRNVVVEVR